MLLAVITVSVTMAAIKTIESSVRAEYGASLNAVMNTTEAALMFWTEQRKSELLRLSENEIIQSITYNLIEAFENKELQNLAAYRESTAVYMNSLDALQTKTEYHLISTDGLYLYSSRALFNSQESPISSASPQLFQQALNGEASFIPPMKIKTGPSTFETFVFFIAPILFEEKVIGVIASSHNPEGEMSQIMSLGRIGDSGESYIINKEGLLVSRSRFKDKLIRLDRIAESESEILAVQLTVPDKNSPENNQLTEMAKSITRFESSQNLSGYLGYRDIEVIGTWKWLPELHLGIATEISFAEANVPFEKAKTTIIALVAINIGIALFTSIVFFVMSNSANKKLRKSASILEETVDKRTHELINIAKELESQKITLQGVLDNIPDPIFCKNSQGRYVQINKSFAELTGYSQAFIVGKTDFELYAKDEAEFFTKDDEKLMSNGLSHIVERVTNDVRGKELLFETRKTLIHYAGEDKAGILGISRDITDRKRYEGAMLNATRAAQEASNAKSEFLARMSHEIRTPMNGVLGMIDLLLDTRLTTDQTHKLKVAKNSASSLLTIINDILDFSRVEAGKMELESLDFNLPQQIENIAQTLAIRSNSKGIELIVDVSEIQQKMVIGDPVRLRQVLTNLISNAIKFTDVGQVLVKAKTKNLGDITQLECSVEDTGIGIPDSKLEHLFESFMQVDTSTTRVYGGSGLGLAICDRLIELMGGKIQVSSNINQGSVFSFTIELKTSLLEDRPLDKSNIVDWQVLVVDDNETNREILSSQLARWGVKTILATDASDALNKLNSERLKLDLIITDMNMPNKDGLSLVADIKLLEQYKDVKILMLSSMSFQMSTAEFSSLGLDACLVKPVGSSELFNTMAMMSLGDADVDKNVKTQDAYKQSPDTMKWPNYHKVLIVEDNSVNQLVAEGILKKFGLRYGVAIDGSIAIQTLMQSQADQPYTLILMDCQMPVLDGYKATVKIRQGEAGERYKDIPIIAMTANAMKGDREKCLQSGMNDHVPKPIDVAVLQKALVSGFSLTPKPLLKFHVLGDVDKNMITDSQIIIPHDLLTMDWESAPPILINQPNIYLKSLAMFKKQHDDTVFVFPNIRGDMDLLRDKLHTIKGSSGNVGLIKLYRLAIVLEEKISENKLIPSDLESFNLLLNDAIADIDNVIEVNKQHNLESKKKRPVKDILNEIMPLVSRSELVPFELVDELADIAKDQDDDFTLHVIVNALEEFDYEKTKKLIEGTL
jgi:PAS domain S-box-containing protein